MGRHRVLQNPRILDVVPAVCGACVQLYGGNADGAQHRRVIHLSLHVQNVAQSAFLPLFFRTLHLSSAIACYLSTSEDGMFHFHAWPTINYPTYPQYLSYRIPCRPHYFRNYIIPYAILPYFSFDTRQPVVNLSKYSTAL